MAIVQDIGYGYSNFLYMIISIATYLEVARRIHVNFGRYDYRLFLMMTVLTFLSVFPKVMLTTYGPHLYWCAEKNSLTNFLSIMITVGIPILTTIICFIRIRISLAKRRFIRLNNADLVGDRTVKTEEEIIIGKVARYVLVFVLQYIPMLVFAILVFIRRSHQTQTWSYVLLIFGFSCGGIGNAINFILSERLKTTEVKITDPDFSLEILSIKTSPPPDISSPALIRLKHESILEIDQDIAGFPTNLR
ncbi:11241_t:CDS:2 [Ambispora leptoticha]|uniref:11241_t:CDS:1 n=1 Tax=Ambispora leptoticha TaxID=144679 RepID=A0A9N8VZM6_9GLOM|nr:11241_t:CDS:2 [Ambispora leptoticha]